MVKSDRTWSPTETDLDWIEATSRPLHPVLVSTEEAAEPEHIPILSRDSGRMLAVLATGRRRVIEVGTAIGYSTLWMALALPSDGTIVTIDPDRSRTDRARTFWREAGLPDARITVVNEPALEAFAGSSSALAGPFDMVFIDALKDEYLAYLAALMDRLAPGAIVVADNVLWSGRTSGARPSRPGDGSDALREFCARVSADPAFETTILPIGDGLLVAALKP
ncbi:MAG TPA: O-methyltransferase [Candidatus Limnocylindrales bacterium]|nr:O-methyltransferase [Candidatus Limnocylindrales bacterium]